MKTKLNKKFWLFAAALAFAVTLVARPVDVKAAPAAPTGLYQSYQGIYDWDQDSVKVAWTADVQAKRYGVQISAHPTGAEGTYSAETTVYSANETFYNLNAGSTYYVRVRAYDSTNTPGPWAYIKVDTAPGDVTVKQTKASEKSITVSYTGSAGATGYYIFYGTSDTRPSQPYKETTLTSIDIPVNANTGYYVWVIPYRNTANPNYKVYRYSYRTVAVSAPTAPEPYLYKTSPSDKVTEIGWTATSTASNTSGYQVEVYYTKNTKGSLKKLTSKTIDNKYTTSLKLSSTKLFSNGFRYRIRAYVTIDGKKYYGNWSSYKYYVPSAQIKSKITKVSSSNAKISWNKVTGATSYTVYWKKNESDSWKAVKKNVKGTSATVKYSSSSLYNYYYVKANKVKVDKKTCNGVTPKPGIAYSYSRFVKKYYW